MVLTQANKSFAKYYKLKLKAISSFIKIFNTLNLISITTQINFISLII